MCLACSQASGRPGHGTPQHTELKDGQILKWLNIRATTCNLETKFYLEPYKICFLGQNGWMLVILYGLTQFVEKNNINHLNGHDFIFTCKYSA